MRKVLILVMMVVLLLTGCDKDDFSFGKSNPNQDDVSTAADTTGSTGPSGSIQVPMPADEDLQFELDGSEPNFEEGTLGVGGAVDLSQTPDYSSQLEDPTATPTDNLSADSGGQSGSVTPATPTTQGTSDNKSQDAGNANLTPSQETPTEETKYPNTGIFLEDD